MDEGRITEVGSYAELIDNDGAFAEFIRTYTSMENEEEDPGNYLPFFLEGEMRANVCVISHEYIGLCQEPWTGGTLQSTVSLFARSNLWCLTSAGSYFGVELPVPSSNWHARTCL